MQPNITTEIRTHAPPRLAQRAFFKTSGILRACFKVVRGIRDVRTIMGICAGLIILLKCYKSPPIPIRIVRAYSISGWNIVYVESCTSSAYATYTAVAVSYAKNLGAKNSRLGFMYLFTPLNPIPCHLRAYLCMLNVDITISHER